MDLLVNRTTRTANSTIGDFSVNGNYFSHCLEPTDRGLTSTMSLADIAAIKVPDKTCIPTGVYNVTANNQSKFGPNVPILNDVPGFADVEIHHGNFPYNTDACLLLGVNQDVDYVGPSDDIVAQFYALFAEALANDETVTITYQ
ncbi:MAG TPA: DUF5675 family protein [Mucilaginibacter sp.]|jgi:hypothetical protein|nr:DUF5675 family protein [Mucilaginibacter sp.]